MRKLVLHVAAVLALSAPAAVPADEIYRLRVNGLACPFCAYGIEKKLGNTEGVEIIDIRINEGLVLVSVGEQSHFDEALARRLVEESGFTLTAFEKIEPDA